MLSYYALFSNSLQMPISSNIFPALSWTNFRVSGLISRSLLHFELILLQGERHGSTFSFLLADSQFSHLLKRLSFLHRMFWSLYQKSDVLSCVDSYLDLLFCLRVSFDANNMLFLFLWLCSIVWRQVLWYLQHCSFCSVLCWYSNEF
jgi:hypothetical protein